MRFGRVFRAIEDTHNRVSQLISLYPLLEQHPHHTSTAIGIAAVSNNNAALLDFPDIAASIESPAGSCSWGSFWRKAGYVTFVSSIIGVPRETLVRHRACTAGNTPRSMFHCRCPDPRDSQSNAQRYTGRAGRMKHIQPRRDWKSCDCRCRNL